MAEIGRFFDGPAYGAHAHAEFYTNFLSTGFFWGLDVTANDTLEVTVASGAAFLEGHEYRNTESLNLEHNIADSSNDRIDRVVIRLDNTPEAERPLRAMIRTGMPNSEPEPPELVRNDAVYEISLAQVLVEAGKSYIEEYQITDERGDINVCGRVSDPNVLTDQINDVDIKRPTTRASDYPRGSSFFIVSGTERRQEWLDSVGLDPSDFGRSVEDVRIYVQTIAQRLDTGVQTITIFDWSQSRDYRIYGKYSRASNSSFSADTDWGSWHEEALVYEQGETANGGYVLYTDGKQECWAVASSLTTTTDYSSQGGFYWGQHYFTFPSPFIEPPQVMPVVNGSAGSGQYPMWAGIRELNENRIDIYAVSGEREGAEALVSYRAVGRWR